MQDLVLTRLSCLARAQDEKDYLLLRTSWDALKARDPRPTLNFHTDCTGTRYVIGARVFFKDPLTGND